MSSPYRVEIEVRSHYLKEQSQPEQESYVFAYTVTIRNTGSIAVRLLSRHWIITDANGKEQEVRGEGVVGEQPYLVPDASFQYTSAAMIETPVGTMHGSYQMHADDGHLFDAPITAFRLALPNILN